MDAEIHQVERDAYYSVLRAFRYQSNELSWEKESLLSDLRTVLRISDDEHIELLCTFKSDETLRNIREWRQKQTGSSSYQHARHKTPQPVHDALHSPTDSAPPHWRRKTQMMSDLLKREDTRMKGEDPGIPYRNQYSAQGRDDAAGAGRIRRVNFKFGGTTWTRGFHSTQDVKGKRVLEDETDSDD